MSVVLRLLLVAALATVLYAASSTKFVAAGNFNPNTGGGVSPDALANLLKLDYSNGPLTGSGSLRHDDDGQTFFQVQNYDTGTSANAAYYLDVDGADDYAGVQLNGVGYATSGLVKAHQLVTTLADGVVNGALYVSNASPWSWSLDSGATVNMSIVNNDGLTVQDNFNGAEFISLLNTTSGTAARVGLGINSDGNNFFNWELHSTAWNNGIAFSKARMMLFKIGPDTTNGVQWVGPGDYAWAIGTDASNSTSLRIKASTNFVGVGTDSPDAKLSVAGHYSGALAPSASAATSTCSAVSVSGTDVRGTVTATCIVGNTAAVSFGQSYATAPLCSLTPTSASAVVDAAFISSTSTSQLSLTATAGAGVAATWAYVCIQ